MTPEIARLESDLLAPQNNTEGRTQMPMTVPAPDKMIKTAVVAAAGLGVPGLFLPGLDEGGMTLIWGTMVTTLAHSFGAELSPVIVAKYVAAGLSGVAAYTLGSKVLTWAAAPLLVAVPFAGVPAAVALNSGLNGLFTLRLGRRTHQSFQSPQFTSADLMGIARHLIGIPLPSEISDLYRMLADR